MPPGIFWLMSKKLILTLIKRLVTISRPMDHHLTDMIITDPPLEISKRSFKIKFKIKLLFIIIALTKSQAERKISSSFSLYCEWIPLTIFSHFNHNFNNYYHDNNHRQQQVNETPNKSGYYYPRPGPSSHSFFQHKPPSSYYADYYRRSFSSFKTFFNFLLNIFLN